MKFKGKDEGRHFLIRQNVNENSGAENSISNEETCICLCKDKLKAAYKSQRVRDIDAENRSFLQIKINFHWASKFSNSIEADSI